MDKPRVLYRLHAERTYTWYRNLHGGFGAYDAHRRRGSFPAFLSVLTSDKWVTDRLVFLPIDSPTRGTDPLH